MLTQAARAAATRMVAAQQAWQAGAAPLPDATLRYGTVLAGGGLQIDGFGAAWPAGSYTFLEAATMLAASWAGGDTGLPIELRAPGEPALPSSVQAHVHEMTVATPPALRLLPGDRVLIAWLNRLSEPCVVGRVTRAVPASFAAGGGG